LLDIPVLYLSRTIARNKADDYSGLLSVTRTGAWEPWLVYMLVAVTETARWTTKKIVGLRARLEETKERIRRDAGAIYSRELAELVLVRPYCRIAHVVEAGLAQRQTTSTYLVELAAIGILREHKIGREKAFLNPAFIELLKRDLRRQPPRPATVTPGLVAPHRLIPPQSSATKPLCTRSAMRTAMLRAGSNGRSSNPKDRYNARTSSSRGCVSTQEQPTSFERPMPPPFPRCTSVHRGLRLHRRGAGAAERGPPNRSGGLAP
jgi:hypothetical protein